MRQWFLVLAWVAVVASRQASLNGFLAQEPTTLQEKTIKAIESLSLVLNDLKESMTKEGNAATPIQPQTEGKVEAVLLNLTAALQNNTRALREAHGGDSARGGEAECEVPYWRLGDECYYVNQHLRVSWSEARLFCRGLGSDLAQPSEVAKLRAALLMRYPEDHHSFFWLGASEVGGTEGNWRWMSGARVRPGDWARDQPDGGNENCVVLSRDEHPSLHDSPCYTHTTFICQATNATAARTAN
ncbi:hypothetical protein O3P69_001908 [Scylla paramamosain]|uniref:C-type lectin domain-containing protein n=1 Tax=Scylla paramamosain TaxID=85552 RepID=A0AAW0V2V5_SCYPA